MCNVYSQRLDVYTSVVLNLTLDDCALLGVAIASLLRRCSFQKVESVSLLKRENPVAGKYFHFPAIGICIMLHQWRGIKSIKLEAKMAAEAVKKIGKKIVGYSVVGKDDKSPKAIEPEAHRSSMEGVKRPNVLEGKTYKLKTKEGTMYVTINDIVLNNRRRPYEVFIFSKDMRQLVLTTGLTRQTSAIFRKGGEYEFIADEMMEILDPSGGYFLQPDENEVKGWYCPSVVAHIGYVLKKHFLFIKQENGDEPPLPDLVPEDMLGEPEETSSAQTGEGIKGRQCSKCSQFTVVRIDGCDTCTSCGESKCG